MDRTIAATLRDPRFPPACYGPVPADFVQARAPLDSDTQVDICIIGAGFTGLSTAIHLAREGYSVRVLEGYRIGHGASGRNGGQLLGGQRQDQTALEKMVGAEDAAKLWTYGQAAVTLARDLIAEGRMDCDLQTGAVYAGFRASEVAELHGYLDHLQTRYAFDQGAALDRDGLQGFVNSPAYAGGIVDWSSGHLNPLAYVRGLARLAEAAGAVIHEDTAATHVAAGEVRTPRGRIRAEHVVLAMNGYLGGLERRVGARALPINNYILATEPLPEGAALRRRVCVGDTRFVVNYFRTDAQNRLIFGGGESYGYRFPRDIAAKVRKPMAQIFPHLADAPAQDAWGGTVAITATRMPHFALLEPGLWSASGYSGHGVSTATLAGKMIARAISGDSRAFDLMARVPTPAFPGGTALRWPLLVAAMTWFSLRDRLGF